MEKSLVVCLRTFLVFLLVFGGVAAVGSAAEQTVDINDISFYQGPTGTEPYSSRSSARSPRNVILLIGDGMGYNQVLLARLKSVGIDGRLHMERMPVMGQTYTHSANNLVTDSAAAGTALASGIKTNDGMLGMAPDGTHYRTVLQAARARGMATGLVATSTITHATPAAFAAHVRSRDLQPAIAEHMLENKVDVLIGGGQRFFMPRSQRGSSRRDNRDLIAEAQEAGYTYASTWAQLQAVEELPVLALLQRDALTTRPPEPTLAELTEKAIDLLEDRRRGLFVRRRGFFMMVEGSQIDWAGHDNDAVNNVWQMLHFDLAVKAAIDFALADRRTLVIVTSDHETGGLTIPGGRLDGSRLRVAWSTGGHTAEPVPVYALGPGAENFTGVYDNTDLSKKIAALMGINPWPQRIDP